MNQDLSSRIRTWRRDQRFSQEELAARLNVSFATVNRWETGKSSPQKAQLEALTAILEKFETSDQGISHDTSRRTRRGTGRSQVLGTKSMEQMLWDAACSIRGEKDAPKFKDYILPLLFLKRLSDVFDDEINRLAEQFGDREIAVEVLEADPSLVRFYIPREARWPVLSGREAFDWPKDQDPKSLGEQLTTTIRSVVKHNSGLAGVIDLVDFNETRNGEREISDAAIKKIIEKFSDLRYRLGLQDVEPDFLGRCYEYLLRKFAEGQGQSAGEFFTPTEVGFLMAELMRPKAGEECYDYACGSLGLLIKLQIVCRQLDPLSKVPLKLYGQELTGSSYAIACMNKIIHDMEGEVVRGDSMRNPKFRDGAKGLKRFDIVVANPMWNQPFDAGTYEDDPFNRFEEQGGVTTSKADWAWLQHTLATMKDTGRAAVVLDTGAVTRGSGSKNEDKERNIRKWFVENDYIDGVILLPDNLFYNTSAAGIILILRKNKPKNRKGKITLIDAGREFRKGTPKNFLPEDAVQNIADVFHKGTSVDGICAVIDLGQAKKTDFNLSPSRYLATDSDNSFRSIQDLLGELDALQTESDSLSASLRDMLHGAGGL